MTATKNLSTSSVAMVVALLLSVPTWPEVGTAQDAGPGLNGLKSKHGWTFYRGTSEGEIFLMRLNGSAEVFVAHPSLKWRFGVAIPWATPNRGGWPNPAETWSTGTVEDILDTALHESGQGILVGVITNGVMREFFGYVCDDGWAGELLERIKRKDPRVQCILEEDPSWETYERFRDSGHSRQRDSGTPLPDPRSR